MGTRSKSSRRLQALAAVVVIVAVLGIAFWLRQRRAERPAMDDTNRSLSASSTDPAPAIDQLHDPTLAVEATDDLDALTLSEDLRPAPAAPTWRLRGLVLHEQDRTGVSGVRVTITALRAGDESATSSLSNALGEFELEFSGEHWRIGQVRTATAIDELTGAQRFQGPVRLDPGFTLLLEELVTLRGRVATSLRPREPRLELTFTRPTTPAARVRRFAASARTDETGWFEQAARVPAGVDVLRLSVAVDGRTAALFDAPLEQLTSPSGIELFVELCELRLFVRDASGAPLPGAEVRAAAFDSDPDNFPPVAASDEHGEVRLALPAADYELCVGKSGYCSRVEHLQLPPQGVEFELALDALAAEHEFFGVVIDDAGAPVERAFVALAPRTYIEELSAAGINGQRTDSQGEFRLRACSSAELELTAFHREFGLSAPLAVRADGIRLVVQLQRTGKLEVDVLTDALPGEFRDGALEYVLASTDGREPISGVAYQAPFSVDELRAGDYDVYVTVPGMRACAVGFARVEANRSSQALLAAQRASRLGGRVLDADGAALGHVDVIALDAWPEAAAQVLLWSRTDRDGRFHVLCPRTPARWSVRDERGELGSHAASAGESLELRLP